MSTVARIVVSFGLLIPVPLSARGADRAVLVEHFHATW